MQQRPPWWWFEARRQGQSHPSRRGPASGLLASVPNLRERCSGVPPPRLPLPLLVELLFALLLRPCFPQRQRWQLCLWWSQKVPSYLVLSAGWGGAVVGLCVRRLGRRVKFRLHSIQQSSAQHEHEVSYQYQTRAVSVSACGCLLFIAPAVYLRAWLLP